MRGLIGSGHEAWKNPYMDIKELVGDQWNIGVSTIKFEIPKTNIYFYSLNFSLAIVTGIKNGLQYDDRPRFLCIMILGKTIEIWKHCGLSFISEAVWTYGQPLNALGAANRGWLHSRTRESHALLLLGLENQLAHWKDVQKLCLQWEFNWPRYWLRVTGHSLRKFRQQVTMAS